MNRITTTHRRLTAKGMKLFNLISGNPNDHGLLFPAEVLCREYSRYFKAQTYRPDPKGYLPARQAIRDYYATEGVSLNPDHILLTSGTSEAFLYLFSLLASPGDNFLTPNPAYPLLDEIARLARIELRAYPLDESRRWTLDPDEMRRQIDTRTKAIVLVSPHNPTGGVHGAEEIHGIVNLANEKGLAVISDEVFSSFVYPPATFSRAAAITQPTLLFTLNGISKMLALPALKLGWIAVSGEPDRVELTVDRLETMIDTLLATHTPIQQALPALLQEGGEFQTIYRTEVARRRDLTLEILSDCKRLRFHPPRGGFYLTAEVIDLNPDDEENLVIRLMEEAGVFVHPGFFYDIERGTHIVMSFLPRPEVLQEGLEKLIRCIDALAG